MDNSHKYLDGRKVVAQLHTRISKDVINLRQQGFRLNLVSISVGESEAAQLYVRNQKLIADNLNIGFRDHVFDKNITLAELISIIDDLNSDPNITGIIIQRPVPAHIPIRTIQARVDPLKDVEGMHPHSIGNIVYNDLAMGPCTAIAALELLKQTGLTLKGLEVTVIGHSEIVGKPFAFLLMSEGATVTVCHHMTRNVRIHSRSADAVIIAVGKPGLLTGDMIKPGAAVIDIGINQVRAPDNTNKIVGDADMDTCVDVAGWITPVPGGVGPVTVAILMQNAVTATKLMSNQGNLALQKS